MIQPEPHILPFREFIASFNIHQVIDLRGFRVTETSTIILFGISENRAGFPWTDKLIVSVCRQMKFKQILLQDSLKNMFSLSRY